MKQTGTNKRGTGNAERGTSERKIEPLVITSVEQLQQNIDAHQVTLSPELVAAVDAIHAKTPNPGQ